MGKVWRSDSFLPGQWRGSTLRVAGDFDFYIWIIPSIQGIYYSFGSSSQVSMSSSIGEISGSKYLEQDQCRQFVYPCWVCLISSSWHFNIYFLKNSKSGSHLAGIKTTNHFTATLQTWHYFGLQFNKPCKMLGVANGPSKSKRVAKF